MPRQLLWGNTVFPSFVRFVSMKLFLFWFSRWYNTGVISGSQMGSQLLQNMKIIKQIDVLLWKIWRKYGSVSYLFGYLFGCTNATHSTLIPPALGKKLFTRFCTRAYHQEKKKKSATMGPEPQWNFVFRQFYAFLLIFLCSI